MILERLGLTSIEYYIYSLTNEDIFQFVDYLNILSIVDDNFLASAVSIGKLLGVSKSFSAT